MTAGTDATVLKDHQTKEAAAVLGRAFFDDPFIEYILPDEARRERALPWFMGTGVHYGQRYGEVHTSPEGVEGAAVWLPPGETDMGLFRMMRAGLFAAPFRLGLSPFRRLLGATDYLDALHERDVPEGHWYLMLLGVDPPYQGQGIGGALIQPVLDRADSAGLSCYLETMKERNVTFYKRHGFQVVVEGDLPKGGPYFWTMKRPARSSTC